MKIKKITVGVTALTLLFTGCGSSAETTPETLSTNTADSAALSDEDVFAELMEEVKTRNQSIDAPVDGLEQFKYDFDQGGPLLTESEWDGDSSNCPEISPSVLTLEDAKSDADYLFRLLRTYYGLYTWFGGDETFGKSEEQILAYLENREEIPLQEYISLLQESLDFINDGHFNLEGRQFLNRQYLYCDESILFQKQGGNFYWEGRRLTGVDGAEPYRYVKRALGPEGELTWKLYVPGAYDTSLRVDLAFDEETQTLELPRTIDTKYSIGKSTSPFLMQEREGVLMIQMDQMTFGPEDGVSDELTGDGKSEADFVASAKSALDYSAAVVNLTKNGGGNGDLPRRWFHAFTGVEAVPNYCTLGIAPFGWKPRGDEKQEGMYRVSRPASQFIERDAEPYLIVLTSKETGSSAEIFTDLAHNLDKTLVIGSNTDGVLTGSQTWFEICLPLSGIKLAWGADLLYWPSDYFQEGIGLEPDVYLTGTNQSQRVAKFLKRYLTS